MDEMTLPPIERATPGPWNDIRVGSFGDGRTSRSAEAQVCNAHGVAVFIVTHDGSEEAWANVRLARMAPTLRDEVVALEHARFAAIQRVIDLEQEVAMLREQISIRDGFAEAMGTCFTIDVPGGGVARVHGDPDMTPESRAALGELLAVASQRLARERRDDGGTEDESR